MRGRFGFLRRRDMDFRWIWEYAVYALDYRLLAQSIQLMLPHYHRIRQFGGWSHTEMRDIQPCGIVLGLGLGLVLE